MKPPTKLSPTQRRQTSDYGRGFTLIELLVAISIAAILIAVGLPSFQTTITNQRLAASSSEFVTALQFARSEAIRLQQPVTIKHAGSNGTRDWGAGWTAFVDTNGDGTQAGASETTLRVGAASSAPVTAIGNSNAATRVTFNSDGTASLGSAIVIFCNGDTPQVDGQSRSRAVLISPAGRVRIATDNNRDGVPENDAGVAIASCTAP